LCASVDTAVSVEYDAERRLAAGIASRLAFPSRVN
jgi:hypothetical protein